MEINKKNEIRINNLEKLINNNTKIEKKIFNSKININETLVKSWLNNREFSATLLFRMSEDGDQFKTFHEKCNNKGITITFIETTDGLIFGGYTELEWDNSNKYKNDKSTFIFSFNTNEKYTKRNDRYSISCCKNNGPKFGWGPQIDFPNDNLREGRSVKSDSNSFVLNNPFTNGKDNWETKELEIYQIKY